MTTTPSDLAGLKLGNYRLERVLGEGRMGVVYLARDEALLRPTAVKIMAWAFHEPAGYDPQAWFLAEARNIARVNHPSVIQVYGVARHGAYCYIAMEYVEGTAADRLVAKSGPFESISATEILLQIAGALQAAHECDIVHRDIKPANILIKADGTAKLGDFGMALHRHDGRAHRPSDRDRVGTPQYTAPEIWQFQPANPATDLYALGATYYFLLTGCSPFDTKDLHSMMLAHLHAAPPDPRDLNPNITEGAAAIIERCLAKSPRERFRTAQELAWELRGLLRTLGSPTLPPRSYGSAALPHADADQDVEAPEPWTKCFGFTQSPFCDFKYEARLQHFEPFATVSRDLRDRLRASPGTTLVLTGEPGSGKSPLVRGLFLEPDWEGHVAWVEAEDPQGSRSIAQRACCAFGTVSNAYTATASEIEGLLEYLERTHTRRPHVPVLVVDSVLPTPTIASELSALARAAFTTRYLSIVLIGPPELTGFLTQAWTPAASEALQWVNLPALAPRQMLDYLQRILQSARSEGSPLVLMTPDAALLVAHHSQGNLAKAHHIVTDMLQLAAWRGTRVLTSWEAWAAAERAPMAVTTLEDHGVSRKRPSVWPPPDVIKVINESRLAVGIPHRRRHQ